MDYTEVVSRLAVALAEAQLDNIPEDCADIEARTLELPEAHVLSLIGTYHNLADCAIAALLYREEVNPHKMQEELYTPTSSIPAIANAILPLVVDADLADVLKPTAIKHSPAFHRFWEKLEMAAYNLID